MNSLVEWWAQYEASLRYVKNEISLLRFIHGFDELFIRSAILTLSSDTVEACIHLIIFLWPIKLILTDFRSEDDELQL